jgi:hypothetical protein
MDAKSTWFLTVYLLVATLLSCWLVYSLWSAQPTAAGQPPVPTCDPKAGAKLSALHPDNVTVGSTVSFLIIGCVFTPGTQVKFNDTPHEALYVDASHMRAGLTSADVASVGTIKVTLSNDAHEFGRGELHIVSPTLVPLTVDWQFFRFKPWPISNEVQLLLMVLFIGAFASCVYALKSLADYRGDDKLYKTWFTYYLIQPFEGGGAALLLYLLIRGGLFAGSTDVKAENRFGMCAIAGLAGAFSDTAFLKLREVFINLLKPKDDRGGKLTLGITTTNLPDGTVGTFYKYTLQTRRETPPLQWSVTPGLPAGLKLDASTGTISGTPTVVSAKTPYKFTVTDSAPPPASSTADLTLEVK